MTQEQKDLLLKDLCGRVSYNPKFTFGNNVYTLDGIVESVNAECVWTYCLHSKGIEPIEIELCRPYLFPLSSMTEEQKNECFNGTPLEIDKYGDIAVKDDFYGNSQYTDLEIYLEVIDWLNAHHFDYRSLINKGLAIDATNLGIYK